MNSLTRSGGPSEPRTAAPCPPPQPAPGSPGAAAAGRALAQMDAELPQAAAQTAPDAPHDRRRHLARRSLAAGAGGRGTGSRPIGAPAQPTGQWEVGRATGTSGTSGATAEGSGAGSNAGEGR